MQLPTAAGLYVLLYLNERLHPIHTNTNTQLIDIVDLNKDGLNDLITLSDDNEHIVWNRNYINWADTMHYFFTDTIISIDELKE